MITKLLSRLRIQEKFTLIMFVGSVIALVMVAITIVVYEIYTFKSNLLEELDIQGDIINEHLNVAMDFGDRVSASDSLSAFNTNPNILKAMVVAKDDTIFAAYVTAGNEAPERLSISPGYKFTKRTLILVKEISNANQTLGFLYIEHAIPLLAYRLAQYLPLFLISALALGLMSFIISIGSKLFIVKPMLQLTNMADKVSKTHDYSIRSEFKSDDEIGVLASTLNELLSDTENHRNTLISINQQLAEQTVELVKQRRNAEDAKRDFEKLAKNHELLLSSANEGIIELDNSGFITFANPKAATILELDEDSILENNICHFFVDKQAHSTIDADKNMQLAWEDSAICQAMKQGTPCKVESEIWLSDKNTEFHIGYSFATMLDDFRQCTGGVLMFQDITARKNADRQLVELANNDPLTHLSNRRYFYDALSKAMSRTERNNSILAILYIDIDHFKAVNDTYGHIVGDQILVGVAEGLKSCIRSGDVLSRLAGDEFAILLFDIRSPGDAQATAEKIVAKLSIAHHIGGQEIYSIPSIGIAMYPGVGDSCDDVIRAADAAMYQVKKMGRSGIQFFEAKLQNEAESRNRIIQQLNHSVFDDEFTIVYQPKFSLILNKMIGMEALLRWNCEGKSIPPDIFIPIAEESGKICDIGEWVLRKVCHQISEWQRTIPEFKELCVAVNVSPRQLRFGSFEVTIDNALKAAHLKPGSLEIEITETAVMDDPETVIDELCRIRKLGVKISIDDFGTGYSSLNYLKRLPISELKIDKGFTMDIGLHKNDEAIVRAVIAIGHSLYIDVIAEGVENLEQLIFLDQNHCDQVQGYYFSKPLSKEDFEDLFKDNSWKFEHLFLGLIDNREHRQPMAQINHGIQ